MGKFLTLIFLFLITLDVFPQGVIKNRSPQGYVSITRDASGTQNLVSLIKGRSAQGYVNIIPEVKIIPPRLQADNPQLIDTDGNNFINANEEARIFFIVRNTGEGPAMNLEARVTENNKVPGLTFQSKTIGTLQPGEVKTVEIPVTSNINTANSTASFCISNNRNQRIWHRHWNYGYSNQSNADTDGISNRYRLWQHARHKEREI